MGSRLIITIDGPAGAGKSTVARAVAETLGYLYLDTGAMYRALAWKALHLGIDPSDSDALGRLAHRARISLIHKENEAPGVFIDGEDVTDGIREPAVGAVVSRIASMPEVRRALTSLQRELALGHADGGGPDHADPSVRRGVVLEGRDTGTHVVPEAHLKIFLNAEPEERVRRRYRQIRDGGREADRRQISKEIEERDRLDTTRTVAPLTAPPDAVVIDSTHMTVEEVVSEIISCLHGVGSRRDRV